jgi:tetratricopeptide (TPR) repeat protein
MTKSEFLRALLRSPTSLPVRISAFVILSSFVNWSRLFTGIRWAACLAVLGCHSSFAAPAAKSRGPAPQPVEAKSTVSDEARKLVEKGVRAYVAGRLDDAAAAFQSFLKIAPGNLTGLVNLGVVEYRRKNHAEAVRWLTEAVRLDLDNAMAWLTLGMLHYDQGNYDAALAALSRAALLAPKDATVHNYLAATIGSKGWLSGAEIELQKAVELDPDYGDAHFNLAVFYLQRTPPAIELARRHYQKARDLGQPADTLVEKALDAGK